MNRRGVTLIELLVGVATAVVIGAVSAGILKAGIMTYTHSVRQNEALTRLRKALGGEASAFGVLRASRAANAVSALSADTVGVVTSTSVVLTSYYVSGGKLYRSVDGVVTQHADEMTTVAVNYYNLDANGLIYESSVTASAMLVTAQVTLQGKTGKLRDYSLFSGTVLRNHPSLP